jgi:ferric-dicitrate binding protein FerR (iron transport regulator)
MAKNNDQQEPIAEISRQAAVVWLLLKDQPRLSLDDAWRILLWMMRSRRHVYELLAIRRLDARFTRLMRAKSTSKVVHVNWFQGSSVKPAQIPRRRCRTNWSIAATVMLMLSMLLFLAPRSDETPDEPIRAAAKELNTRLEDGSQISLDALASMQVDFTAEQRGVHLFHGKSLFDVVEGRERPFVVHTFLIDIRSVVKSKFAVQIDTTVEVEVYEGVVEISERGAKAGSTVVTVEQGQKYRVPLDQFRAIVADGSDTSRVVLRDGRT